MGLRESLIITEFISNEPHLFRNNPMEQSIYSEYPLSIHEWNYCFPFNESSRYQNIKCIKKKKKKQLLLDYSKQKKKKNEKNSSKRNNRRERVEVVDDKSFLIIKLAVFFLPLNVTESLNTLIFHDSILNFKSGELFDRYSKWREPTRRRQRHSRWGKEEKRLEHYKWSRPPSQ